MIIDFLPNSNANYHDKQLSYLKAASHEAQHLVLLTESDSNQESAAFYFKENLRDDTWDDNHQD